MTKARGVAPCITKPLNFEQMGDLFQSKKHGNLAVKKKNVFKSKSSEAFANRKV